MRPIDADELKITLTNWIRLHWDEAFTADDMAYAFLEMINEELTLKMKPVVHAHWVPCEDEYEDEYKCSACGGTQFFAMTPQNEGWEYCPKCGAKMDEEENT
ncbi:MAG: hypothetical protein SOU32_00530 [Lachnospiraceae bacterium]|nr:hypothetical protein [Lachnospiraceae bacterium]